MQSEDEAALLGLCLKPQPWTSSPSRSSCVLSGVLLSACPSHIACTEIPISGICFWESWPRSPTGTPFCWMYLAQNCWSSIIPVLSFLKSLHKLTLPPVVHEHISYAKSLSKLGGKVFPPFPFFSMDPFLIDF